MDDPLLIAATEYVDRGWHVVPVPFRSKKVLLDDWPQLRLNKAELPAHFNGNGNVGVLLGEPSGWIVDVDLDHPRVVELADKFLPETAAVFGRPGKPRSHRLYRVSAPAATKKFRSKSAGMLVELRSTGQQTVFPPSIHESGEPITWETESAEPALMEPDVLLEAVARLANAVKIELGEKQARKPRKPAGGNGGAANGKEFSRRGQRLKDRMRACLSAMLRMQMVDQKDGSSRLFAAACRAVEYDLNDEAAIAAIRDYARQRPFPTEWTDDQILARVRDAEQKTQRGVIRRQSNAAGKVKILIDTEEHRVVSETIEALSIDPVIFQRGGVLVRVIRDQTSTDSIRRCQGSATITFLPQASLRERMTKHTEFTALVKRADTIEEVLTHPTQWLVAAVDARGEWPGIRQLNGLSDVPILRADGTLFQTPGYDQKTGVLYQPTGTVPVVPNTVSFDAAIASVESLFEIVADFRFESEEHRSAWLAGLLTPLARFAFDGPAPLFLIDANVRAAGKGLLAQTIGQIVLGREMPVSSYAHDSEEMRKKITAIALAGDRLILLDNLAGNFGNDTLDRALTSTRWKDRILGKSQEVDLPLIPVWYGTGNNVAVAADTARRIIHIRLDVLDENPEERTDFRHPELIAWVKQNRGQFLAHALTILRGYFEAGAPSQDLKPFGSFEGWSGMVRQPIVWLGLPDPCLTRLKLAESSDTTADALGQLISAWREYDRDRQGIVVSDLVNNLYSRDYPPRDEASVAMRAALENLVGCPPGKAPGPRQVGAKFKFFRRRVVGNAFIDTNPNEHNRHGAVWRLDHA